MELHVEWLAAGVLIAAVVVSLVWRRWFGPKPGSSSWESDSSDGGDGGGD
jgi:uncharacterized membrane protein